MKRAGTLRVSQGWPGFAAVLDHQSSRDNRAPHSCRTARHAVSHRPTGFILELLTATQLALSELNVLIWSKRIPVYFLHNLRNYFASLAPVPLHTPSLPITLILCKILRGVERRRKWRDSSMLERWMRGETLINVFVGRSVFR